MRNLITWMEKWISVRQLVPVLFRVFRSTGIDNGRLSMNFFAHIVRPYVKKSISQAVLQFYTCGPAQLILHTSQ